MLRWRSGGSSFTGRTLHCVDTGTIPAHDFERRSRELAHAVAGAVVEPSAATAPSVKLERPGRRGPRRLRHRRRDVAGALAAHPRRARSPTRIAERLDSPLIASVEVAGPGLHQHARVAAPGIGRPSAAILAAGRPLRRGRRRPSPQRIQVEYVSGNPTGPVTAATARNAAYGDSLARLLRVRRARRRARVLLQRRRPPDRPVRRRRCGRGRGARSRPRTATRASTWPRSQSASALGPDAPADEWRRARRRGHDGRDQAHARSASAPPSTRWFLERSLYEDGSVDRAIARLGTQAVTRTSRTGRAVAALDRLRRRPDRVLVRSDGNPTYIAGDVAYIVNKLERGFDVGRVRARLRPPRLHRPAQGGGRSRSATTPTGSTSRSTSS